ncbi:MAG: amidohydrolase family protein [Candidatus Hydrogenedentota bacterium]|nr:MAG: amidohydrolase family protein [Candidatus Hydrogenedentota bacterium]
MGTKLEQRLHDEICQIEIIDTHEHLVNREMLADLGFNLFQAIELHYLKDDLMALGMDENLILEKGSEPDSLVDELLPLLKLTQNTTYYQAFFHALRDLHGLEGNHLDRKNLKAVSESIKTAYRRQDWYAHAIRDKCKIKYMLRDMEYMPTEDDFVRPVIRMDNYLILRHKNLLKEWTEKERILTLRVADAEYQARVRSLDDYLSLMEEDFQKALAFGAVAIKIAIAYRRTLQFDNVPVEEAKRAFKLPDEKTTWKDIKAFQDYMIFRIIESAAKHGLPVQIHTGLLAEGKNTLGNSNPLHLSNIFLEFPQVRFDIFHGAFPFMGEIGSLALMFPNVYLDTCWLPLISYTSFKNALS